MITKQNKKLKTYIAYVPKPRLEIFEDEGLYQHLFEEIIEGMKSENLISEKAIDGWYPLCDHYGGDVWIGSSDEYHSLGYYVPHGKIEQNDTAGGIATKNKIDTKIEECVKRMNKIYGLITFNLYDRNGTFIDIDVQEELYTLEDIAKLLPAEWKNENLEDYYVSH